MINRPGILALFCVLGGVLSTDRGEAAEPKMSYLDNGVIRLGVNLDAGGAIAYLSKSGDDHNLVNNWDWGRQIQMSHYSGPVPFRVPGKEPFPHWQGLGWNPVQAGDHFRNPSKVVAHRNDGQSLYVKSIPMQYALDNVPAECTFESWISLDGKTAKIHSRMVVDRPDKTQYPARNQELPAIYTVGTLYRLMSYTGEKPFSGERISRIVLSEEEKRKGAVWTGSFLATEGWAALVDDRDWGIGIVKPRCFMFCGGFAGEPGQGGAFDGPTGYLGPLELETIDHNITYAYDYMLVVGTLQEIRRLAYDRVQRFSPPNYRFAADRQHGYLLHATDAGWPIRGALHVLFGGVDPQWIGPAEFWLAKDAPLLRIEAACQMKQPQAECFWKRYDDDRFTPDKSLSFPLEPDGAYHVYTIDLSASKQYRGAITGLRVDPTPQGAKGEWIKIKSIALCQKTASGTSPAENR